MRNITHTHTTAAALAAALALGVAAESAVARGGFGEDVDAFCQTYDGSTPFADLGGNTNSGLEDIFMSVTRGDVQ